MQKTFITRLPEQTGAFLDACRMIWNTGACITRVSYNKAVDTHTLFLDADGVRGGERHSGAEAHHAR